VGERRLRGVIQQRRGLLREGLALWIAAQDDLELVATAETGPEMLVACEEGPLDFVLFEADAAAWDPIGTADALRRRHPGLRLVATGDDPVAAHSLVAAHAPGGPCAVLPRSAGIDEVLAAVRGGPVRVELQLPVPDPRVLLTDRQLEILVYVGMGLAAREIADRLGISPKTVDNHKQRIYARLGVQSQAHAVAVAIRAGLIPGVGEAGRGFAS
jgi:DNA-binding NarL/FixJ family response regulator